MNLVLVRHAYLKEATLGNLLLPDAMFATLEEPWSEDPDGPGGQRREEGKAESCVPDGTYELVPHNSTSHPNVWCLVNPALGVYRWDGDIPKGQKWGRSTILIHAGNTTKDILGCVLVGLRHGELGGVPAVLESRKALDALRRILLADTHTLEIRPTFGTTETL